MPEREPIWITLDAKEQAEARRIGQLRLDDLARHHSADFSPALNPTGQTRGAAGELATAKWLRSAGFEVEVGFMDDDPWDSDITVNGTRVEVMTTRTRDRLATGTCVPPGKLRAARRRGAWGYVFPATVEDDFTKVLIQAVALCEDIDRDPFCTTEYGRGSRENFVVREECLVHPSVLVEFLKTDCGRP